MFRQIRVDESDQRYQCILWRFNRDEPVQVFALKTVTYGLACSPFFAIRMFLQLATEK